MSSTEIYESLIQEIGALDRRAIIERLANFQGQLRLDFSQEYLHRCDTERLRHILLAAMWHCRTKSEAV